MSFDVISSERNSTIENIKCLRSEREALLKFKDEISHGYCGFMTSWGHPDCCTWNGVACSHDSGHVIGLILAGAPYDQLDGCFKNQVISSSLGELKHLTYLDLSNNNFHGAVIPNFIGNLINLTELYLTNSHFGGEVPNHLGNLTRLMSLDLSSNDGLYVESMHWLSRLAILEDVNLGGIDLSKANDWSQVVGSLLMLKSLQMDGCGLPSPVSSSYLQSPNLSMISLSRNSFTGSSVFQWLFNSCHDFAKLLVRSLHHLDLSSNSIEGPIPDMIGNLVLLTYLKLSNNSLSGILPRTIQNLESLTYLDLSHNSLSLSGSLYDSFGKFDLLTNLDLSCNLISGTLPDPLSNLVSLEYLNLSRNSFSGPLPYIIENVGSLSHLDLSHNLLNGTISYIFTSLPNVFYLDLSYNLLHGPISDTIPNPELTADYLDLSHNLLSGTIPDAIVNFNSITYLYLSHNLLSGTIPGTIGDISYTLAYLDLSYNSLSGPVPASIWNVAHIDISNNPLLILTEVKNKGDDKMKIGLYVSIGIGIYTGFCGFWATLAMKDNWRFSYFMFLDHKINKHFGKYRRNYHA